MNYMVVACILAICVTTAASWEESEDLDDEVLRAYSLSQDAIDEIAREIRKPRRPQGRSQRNIQPLGYPYNYAFPSGSRVVREGGFQGYNYPDGSFVPYQRDACRPAVENGGFYAQLYYPHPHTEDRTIAYPNNNYQPISWEKPPFYPPRDYRYNVCQPRERGLDIASPTQFTASTQSIPSPNIQSIFTTQPNIDPTQHQADEPLTSSEMTDFVTEDPTLQTQYLPVPERAVETTPNFRDSLETQQESFDGVNRRITQWEAKNAAPIEEPVGNFLYPTEMSAGASQPWFLMDDHHPESNIQYKSGLEPYEFQMQAMLPMTYPPSGGINNFVPYYDTYFR